MQITKDFSCIDVPSLRGDRALRSTKQNVISSLKFEKLICSFNAIFEGIGIAGIISAAFWYATAPMAPNGFNGPIATFTIAITTIASLFIAIPIAYSSYKKIIHSLHDYHAELYIESKRFDDSLENLHFELLKLRALFSTDNEFLKEVKVLMCCQIIQLAVLRVCKVYSIYSNKYYSIKWHSSSSLVIYEDFNRIESIKFTELMKQNALINIKVFRKAIVKSTFKFISNSDRLHQQSPITKSFKQMSYAFAAGITCTEVLLSIGWTVASILIGIKVILPISTQSWVVFALLCIGFGSIFGIGIYFNKLKQINRDAVKNAIKTQNHTMNEAFENIDMLWAKKILERQNKINLTVNLNPKTIRLKRI